MTNINVRYGVPLGDSRTRAWMVYRIANVENTKGDTPTLSTENGREGVTSDAIAKCAELA
jgi:hypothetical protein